MMTAADAIATQATVTVHMAGRMVRGRVSAQHHPDHPVWVITLPGGCATTVATRVVVDAITHTLILNW